MLERYTIIGLAFGVTLIFADIMLLRKRKIPGKTFVIWFTVGVSVCVVSAAPSIFSLVGILFGAEYLISTVVAVGFAFFLSLFFYLHYKISEVHSQLMKLTMQISVANYSKKRNEQSETSIALGKDPKN